MERGPAYYAPIEPGIRPVCDALNAIPGVKTEWSCEGHTGGTKGPTGPFVIFTAPVSTAFEVHRLLEQWIGDDSLQFVWQLTANFQDNGTTQYIIKNNDYRVPGGRYSLFRKWNRRSMDAELIHMAQLLKSTLTASVTDAH